jgi:3-oxoacyl-[acyl-carrier-protein] synthase-1
MNKKVYITATNCITPLGFDVQSNINAMLEGNSAIQYHDDLMLLDQPFCSAIIDDKKLTNAFELIDKSQGYSRLEKMLILALNSIVNRSEITSRTAFILSTTKGNIVKLENQNNTIESAQLAVLAKKIANYFGFITEPIVVSNACVSGALAIVVAKRMIKAGVYDNAYVLAGDEVSKFVLSGFKSFQAMSEKPCKPYDKNRDGVTLGEAAAAVYITSDESKLDVESIQILGDGSVNDANHISGPSRSGEGLFRSIESALTEAKLNADQIDFISAHGTATVFNDEMESIAFNRSHLEQVPMNSFKGYFGHTLGTSGLLEIVISIASTNKNLLFASKGFVDLGVTQPIAVIDINSKKNIRYFLKTASGFGGCNTAVVFYKPELN